MLSVMRRGPSEARSRKGETMKLTKTITDHDLKFCQTGTLKVDQVAGIIKLNWRTYTVPSSNGRTRYVVLMDRSRPEFAESCSCPAFANYANSACKHMQAVERIGQ